MLQNRIRFIGFAIVVYCAAAGRASAQDWTWTTDASAFFGYNYQQRKFADFSAWESQNWFMLDGTRELDSGRLSLVAMLSLEPLTVNWVGNTAASLVLSSLHAVSGVRWLKLTLWPSPKKRFSRTATN